MEPPIELQLKTLQMRIDDTLDSLRAAQSGISRDDPAGRQVSIAITQMEDAQLRLHAALDIKLVNRRA